MSTPELNTRAAHSGKGLTTLEEDAFLGDVDGEAWDYILLMRGGCRCFISAPCFACADHLTEQELNSVGYTWEPQDKLGGAA